MHIPLSPLIFSHHLNHVGISGRWFLYTLTKIIKIACLVMDQFVNETLFINTTSSSQLHIKVIIKTWPIYLPGSCDKGMTEISLTGVGVSWGRGCLVLFVPMGWKFLIKKRLGRTNATCLHYALWWITETAVVIIDCGACSWIHSFRPRKSGGLGLGI